MVLYPWVPYSRPLEDRDPLASLSRHTESSFTMDGPSCSHMYPATSDDQDTTEQKDPVTEARENFEEMISVAGWKEAFGERIQWIAHCFKVCLIVLSGFSLYYMYALISDCFQTRYTDEIADIPNSITLPVSNVTICAQVYFNETFVRDNVVLPRYVEDLVLKKHGGKEALDEFYRQLTLFLTHMTRPRKLDEAYVAYFRRVLRANPQIDDYVNFTITATPSCPQMIKKCWFNGIEFDCCKRSVRLFDDDGVCFVLAVSTPSGY